MVKFAGDLCFFIQPPVAPPHECARQDQQGNHGDEEGAYHRHSLFDAPLPGACFYPFEEVFAEGETADDEQDGQDELDAMYRALCAKAKELEINIDEYSPDEDIPKELKWNDGEIRSTCFYDFRESLILIDADFDKCKDITVEAVLEVSGEEFVLKKVKPQENERFARLDFPMFYRCSGYRLMWIEDGRVKYTPTYPIESP